MGKKRKTKDQEPIAEQEQEAVETPEETDTKLPTEESGQEEGADATEETPEGALQRELDAARAEVASNWDLYLRERAELENFRKRSQRDKEDAIRFANDRLLKEMIPVLDNLERAVEHAGQNEGDQEGLLEGVEMTITMFRKALEDFGIKPVAAAGETFDPNLHQAMGQIETDEQPPNTVVTEFQKGYLLNDRLLRPSLVMVAKAPSAESSSEDEPTTENNDEDA